jgi:hypothetical protein
MTEAQLLERVTAIAGELGVYWHHEPDSRANPSTPGFPDLVLGRRRLIFRELKTEHGTLHIAQKAWGRMLTDCGQDWGVWRPHDLTSGLIIHAISELTR